MGYFFTPDLNTSKETNLLEPITRSFDLAIKKLIDFLGFAPQPRISFNSWGAFLQSRPSSSCHKF